ncbi:hypothetical protein EPN90_04180 [Patescibacteria group bacterium]|nr:MAG: hypothetical protein EPN90_04180 [Patescibacteria group bacterium]
MRNFSSINLWGRRLARRSETSAALAAILIFAAAFILPRPVSAAGSYSAQLVSISETALNLKPGEAREVSVTFKNNGGSAWRKSGANYISFYTWEPKYHASKLAASNWRSKSQTGALAADVSPGAKGTIVVTIKAPELPGTYNENFQLAAEDRAWLSGGRFGLVVTVSGKGAAVSAAPPAAAPTEPSAPPAGSLMATRLLMNTNGLTLKGGERSEVSVLFKNSGTAPWGLRKLVHDGGVRIAAGDAPDFSDASWPSKTVALSVAEEVKPGNTVFVRFTLKAPASKGEYSAKFKLTVEDQDVPGGVFELPVSVTENAAYANEAPPSVAPAIPVGTLIPEPKIRIGTTTVPVSTLVLSSASELIVRDAASAELGRVPPGLAVTVKIGASGAFTVTGAGASPLTFSGIARFIPVNGDEGITQVNAGGAEYWNSWVNNGRFRDTLEIRYYAPADVTWVINELPIEKYLYGLAETGNTSPHEYQKALVTAARTYAYWHLTHPGKHITFTLDSTAGDQVYRGYNRELNQPNIVRAVEESRGALVHYNNEVVVTPYYANSDGRTRAWTEVWGGGAKPWLLSVEATYDKGKKMWGHGVGLSARDAAYRADEDKWTWDQILKYYYTGVEVKKLW